MTNEELMEQISAGNVDAADLLYRQNANLIRSIAEECAATFGCLQRTGKQFTAYTEDILQDLCGEGAIIFCERIRSGEYNPTQGKLTTYLYPYIRGAMYRWLEQRTRHEAKTVSIHNLAEDEDSDLLGFQMADANAVRPEIAVYRKICIELLSELFDSLSEKDRSILGHTYGAYGYKKCTTDELALREMLTLDGVVKARKIALRHLREKYPGSRLQIWREAYRKVMDTDLIIG